MESAKRVSLVIEAWVETEMACKAIEVCRASFAIEVERHLVGWIGWLA